jgi:hypothetical protein
MNGYHVFNFTDWKNFFKVLTLWVRQNNLSNFHKFNLSQGKVYDFSTKVQNQGPRNQGAMREFPPPRTFFKSEKSAFFLG